MSAPATSTAQTIFALSPKRLVLDSDCCFSVAREFGSIVSPAPSSGHGQQYNRPTQAKNQTSNDRHDDEDFRFIFDIPRNRPQAGTGPDPGCYINSASIGFLSDMGGICTLVRNSYPMEPRETSGDVLSVAFRASLPLLWRPVRLLSLSFLVDRQGRAGV